MTRESPSPIPRRLRWLAATALLVVSGAQGAQLTALVGKGYSGLSNAGLSYQTDPLWQRHLTDSRLDLPLEYTIGLMHASGALISGHTRGYASLSPMLEWWFEPDTALEVGVGVTLLSGTHVGTRNVSTAFQFADSIGLLHHLGGSAWTLGLRFTHYSNGGIRNPNPGLGFFQLRISHALR